MNMCHMKQLTLLLLIVLGIGVGVVDSQWVKQDVATTASFRGLSVVNENIVWASGTDGTVIRTIDGGKTWKIMHMPEPELLDYRDIEAFDANTAYALSIGNGDSSRIYKTVDGGKTWNRQFTNYDKKAFFDAIACWDKSNCIAMSDPVEGSFVLVSTFDGGKTWKQADKAPKAQQGEAAFAASGTCLIRPDFFNVYIVTGGSTSRVIHGSPSTDTGLAWKSSEADFIKGSSGSGIFSIAMFDAKNGVIVGGDYEKPNEAKDNLAFTSDGGKTWKLGTGLSGYRSGVTYIDKKMIIAVGTNGTDVTRDGGKTWKKIGNEDLNAVAAKGKRAVWAVGPKGMVVKMK